MAEIFPCEENTEWIGVKAWMADGMTGLSYVYHLIKNDFTEMEAVEHAMVAISLKRRRREYRAWDYMESQILTRQQTSEPEDNASYA